MMIFLIQNPCSAEEALYDLELENKSSSFTLFAQQCRGAATKIRQRLSSYTDERSLQIAGIICILGYLLKKGFTSSPQVREFVDRHTIYLIDENPLSSEDIQFKQVKLIPQQREVCGLRSLKFIADKFNLLLHPEQEARLAQAFIDEEETNYFIQIYEQWLLKKNAKIQRTKQLEALLDCPEFRALCDEELLEYYIRQQSDPHFEAVNKESILNDIPLRREYEQHRWGKVLKTTDRKNNIEIDLNHVKGLLTAEQKARISDYYNRFNQEENQKHPQDENRRFPNPLLTSEQFEAEAHEMSANHVLQFNQLQGLITKCTKEGFAFPPIAICAHVDELRTNLINGDASYKQPGTYGFIVNCFEIPQKEHGKLPDRYYAHWCAAFMEVYYDYQSNKLKRVITFGDSINKLHLNDNIATTFLEAFEPQLEKINASN